MYLFQFLLLSGYQPITFYWSKVTFGRLNIKSQKWSPKEPTQSEKAWALVVQTIKDNCLSWIPEQRKGQQQIDIQFRNFVGTFPLVTWALVSASDISSMSSVEADTGWSPPPPPPPWRGCHLDKEGCLSLDQILRSFSAPISEEHAWAVIHQVRFSGN